MRTRAVGAGAFLGLLLIAALPGRARAATFTVTKTEDAADGTCDADCSLREAVIAANAAPGSTIQIPAGLYRLSIAGKDEDAAATGDLDLLADMTIQGAGADLTTVDARPSTGVGTGVDRVFDARSGTAAIRGLTIAGGYQAPYDEEIGAGVRNLGADLTVEDCAVSGNSSRNGSGFGLRGAAARLTLRRSEVSGNGGTAGGSGLYLDQQAAATVEDCWIHHNFVGVNLSQDFSGVGIAVLGAGTRADVVRTTISENRDDSTNPNLGGGVYSSGIVMLVNSTVAGNAVESSGESGGLFLDASGAATVSRMELTHVTVAGHRGSTVANHLRGRNLQAGSIAIANSIFSDAGRPDAPDLPACAFDGAEDGVLSLGGNIADDASCRLTDPTDQPSTDPKLQPYDAGNPLKLPIADNGGFAPTWALTPESPAVDGGAPARCEALDQRGLARDAQCDSGAYELGAGPCTQDKAQGKLDAAVEDGPSTVPDAMACLREAAGL